MLKRYQILLTDWLADYVKFFIEEYDVSFSEAVRIIMCIGAVQAVREIFPQYKQKITVLKVRSILKGIKDSKMREETLHKLISESYFEARKAIEFRLSQEKKKGQRTS